MATKHSAIIEGTVAPGFERCRDAFASALENGTETGAACSVTLDGRTVVDLWGGLADSASGQAWTQDTIVPVFSVSKGVAAICVLQLVTQGLIDLDAPVVRYWPEFGQHGKAAITVREALAHRAGLPIIDGDISLSDVGNGEEMARRLAAQPPIFEPGTAHIYHPVTIGWITGELVRRVTGISIGHWLATNVADPLGLSLYFGLPEADRHRVARLSYSNLAAARASYAALPEGSLPWRALSLNGAVSFGPQFGVGSLDDPNVQALELPGAGLVTNARSLAKFYAACLSPVDGVRLLSEETIAEATRPVSTGAQYGMTDDGPSWGTGVMIPWRVQPMLGGLSFGHDGMGGSLAFASPERQVSFAYVRNSLAANGDVDPQVYAVVKALADTLH